MLLAIALSAALGATSPLAPRAFTPLPLGQLAPQGWLQDQLVLQANSLAGYMSTSTFPGADHVNQSLWIGGDGSKQGGTTQWLPYWSNGNVPLLMLQAMLVGIRKIVRGECAPTLFPLLYLQIISW